MSMNPLLDFSGLPRFADIQPEHVAPAIDQLLSENQALIDRLGADAQAAHLGQLRRAAGRCQRAAVARLGPGRASECGDEQPAAARGLQRHAAQDHPVLRRACRRTSVCTRGTRRCARAPGFAALSREQKKIVDNELRDFRLGGAELRARRRRPSSSSCASNSTSCRRASTTTCSMRPMPSPRS